MQSVLAELERRPSRWGLAAIAAAALTIAVGTWYIAIPRQKTSAPSLSAESREVGQFPAISPDGSRVSYNVGRDLYCLLYTSDAADE